MLMGESRMCSLLSPVPYPERAMLMGELCNP
jgi:hypothetical protein